MNENKNIITEEVAPALMSDGEQDEGNISEPEETQDNILVDEILNNQAVIEFIDKQIQEGIKKALKGKPPKANTADPTAQEMKNFDKMTYRERLNLFKSNPQTYYKLSKGVK